MKISIILHVAIASLVQGAVHRHSRSPPPAPRYGVDELQWSFKSPFGKPTFVNGTVQEIQKTIEGTEIIKLDSLHPGVRPMVSEQERSVAEDTISVRFCGVFRMANSQDVSAQIPAIATISGPAVIGPGPGNCAQVSCDQGSAIWWCNDLNSTIILPRGMEQLGDAVNAVIEECCVATHCRDSSSFPISGQAFSDEEGWNVLVRGENC